MAASARYVYPVGRVAVEAKRKLVLRVEGSLEEELAAAFARVHRYALSMEALASATPAAAVHEFRKSTRRMRAMVRLVAPMLEDDKRRDLDEKLRRAVRGTSVLRDHAVLRGTLDTLEPSTASRVAYERSRAYLVQQEELHSAPELALEVLHESCAWVVPLASEFSSALPDRVKARQLSQATGATVRKVRRAARRACASGSDEEIHRWRKRTKELRYQLELLRGTGCEVLRRLRRKNAELTETLGRATDLMVLEDSLREQFGESHAAEMDPLLGEIRACTRERLQAAFRLARPMLEMRPKQLARRVGKALRS